MVENYKIIETPWLNYFYHFVKSTQKELFVVVPFFSKKVIEKIVTYARPEVKLRFLLGVNLRGIAEGVSDYEALIFLYKQSFVKDIIIKTIPNLHAKILVSDGKRVILSSSNLTFEGLKKNIEFGIEVVGEAAKKLHRRVNEYWNLAKKLEVDGSVDSARERLSRFKKRELKNKQKIPREIPLVLGTSVPPMGYDLHSAPSAPKIEIDVYVPEPETVSLPNDKTNLLFNIWWNDNGFAGPCVDVSDKIVCRNYFLRKYREDLTEYCKTSRDGCTSAYIFSNFANYINANLDRVHLNKCAFFIARNPEDNKYHIIGYLFIKSKGSEGFQFIKEGGQKWTIQKYIKGDRKLSLRFQPYLVFDEAFIRKLSLGDKWGQRESSELDWITRHTRSSASCIYLSNADAVTILKTYQNYTTNANHRRIISEVLNRY